jgi:DNA-binding LacI/PurR family transcriptional regulator
MNLSKDEAGGAVTLEKLAKLAKVSVSTVSRALNDHPSISSPMKKQLWALGAQARLCLPPPHAGQPHWRRRRRHHRNSTREWTPAAVVAPLLPRTAREHRRGARSRLRFTVSHLAPANYDDLVHAITTGRANGVIFLGQGMLHDELQPAGADRQPLVVWGAQFPGQRYCTVGTDNMLGGKRATQHLLKLGESASCSWAAATRRRRSAIAATPKR